jgi:hypothetical protein
MTSREEKDEAVAFSITPSEIKSVCVCVGRGKGDPETKARAVSSSQAVTATHAGEDHRKGKQTFVRQSPH